MAVVASATGAAVFGLSGVAAGLAGGALLGAGIGGLYSAFTGDGDILNSMLTGGLIGGAAGGIGASLAPAAITAPSTLAAAPLSTAAVPTTGVATGTAPGIVAAKGGISAASVPSLIPASLGGSAAAPVATGIGGLKAAAVPSLVGTLGATGAGSTAAGMTGGQMLGYGLAGTAAMQLLGGRSGGKGAIAPASAGDPGMIRPFEYSSNPTTATGTYPSPYLTTSYDAAGNPNMDTRERNYFDQGYTAYQPYSAKIGTVNPNIPVSAANGGMMGEYDDEAGNDDVGLSQGNMQRGLSGLGYAHGGIPRYADRGMVDEEAELRKTVMNNLKRLSPEQMQNVMGSFQQENELEKQFLMKNMPNYAEAMKPSISSMVEGAQYGDRMAQSFGQQPRDVNVMPRVQDLNNYGGIASIGQQVDPNTRVNMMADLQRTPYDQNALESVRRVGAGIDRRIGKDANLSAYYEQDPMGRNKAGGVRYTQQFAKGGISEFIDILNATKMSQGGAADLGDYSDGGRLLKGPGDGVSDSIPATIAGKQPARLADGEFVIPARIVSEIGNGSTDAGAKRLYAMMDRIQAGRKKTIGKKNVAKDTKAKKHLIA